MTLEQFANACGLTALQEVEKVCYLGFFYFKRSNIRDFKVHDAAAWLTSYGFATPNRTRLEARLRSSRNTVLSPHGFRLSVDFMKSLEARFPELSEKSQDVIEHGTILPEPDYKNTRGYIESLAKQINASYEHNIFDACAVLMRRLVEVLLILSYRHLQVEQEIKDANGNYFMLERIVSNANGNAKLDISRNSKSSLELFRQLGNFSAHKIEYTCKKEYIKEEILNYRALVNELLHKAGIRT